MSLYTELEYVLSKDPSDFFYRQLYYRDGGTMAIELFDGKNYFTFLIDGRISSPTKNKLFFREGKGIILSDAKGPNCPYPVKNEHLYKCKKFITELVHSIYTHRVAEFLLEN